MVEQGDDEVGQVLIVARRVVGRRAGVAGPVGGERDAGDHLQVALGRLVDDVIVLVPRALRGAVARVGEVTLLGDLDVAPGEVLLDPGEVRARRQVQGLGDLDLLGFLMQEDVRAVGVDGGVGNGAALAGLGQRRLQRGQDGAAGQQQETGHEAGRATITGQRPVTGSCRINGSVLLGKRKWLG